MKIVGYRKFTSKNNVNYCIVQCETEYTDREKEHGAIGVKCEEVWVPEKYHGLIIPSSLGKNLNVTYGMGSDRKAYITNLFVE